MKNSIIHIQLKRIITQPGSYMSNGLTDHIEIPDTFTMLRNSCCQLKHKMFFWLLLIKMLNTRAMLHKKNFNLPSVNGKHVWHIPDGNSRSSVFLMSICNCLLETPLSRLCPSSHGSSYCHYNQGATPGSVSLGNHYIGYLEHLAHQKQLYLQWDQPQPLPSPVNFQGETQFHVSPCEEEEILCFS